MNEQQLIEKYESQLNEEKWTRTAINNYTIKNFEDLDALVQEFSDNHIQKEINAIIKELTVNTVSSFFHIRPLHA